MMNTLKIAAVGALAALGLTSAAVAQQSSGQKPNMSAQQHQQMSGGMQNGQAMPMMSGPQMRQQVMQMMKGCNQMMQQMGNMPHDNATPKG